MTLPQLTDKVHMKTRDKHSKIYYLAFDKNCGLLYFGGLFYDQLVTSTKTAAFMSVNRGKILKKKHYYGKIDPSS